MLGKSLLTFMLLLMAAAAPAAPLRIAAAANLERAMTEALIPAFEKRTKVIVIPTFGATKLLAAQIENGAPVDVFVSADTATVNQLIAKHFIMTGSGHVYAIGKLVLWSRKDAALHPRRIQDLANGAYVKIAIANPAIAPYGRAAQQALDNTNLTLSVASRLAVAGDVVQSLQFARSGNADAAFTALSLVINDPDGRFILIPDSLHAPIAQSAGIVQATKEPLIASQFLSFLLGKEAAPLWKRYGYGTPPRMH